MVVETSQGRQLPALARGVVFLDGWSFAAAGVLVVSVASFSGGYYPRTWGWGALAALMVAFVVLIRRGNVGLSRREWLMLALAAAFAGWVAATATRAGAATSAVPALERDCFYLAVLWAAMIVLGRRSAGACLGGLLVAIVAVSCRGLESYLFPGGGLPDTYEERLLYKPLGYANAAGVLAAIGAVIALGLVVHGRRLSVRALAAGSLVPLVATIAFSASRGAAAALVLAFCVMLVVDPARLRIGSTTAAVLPIPLLGVLAGSRTHVGDPMTAANVVVREGRTLAGLVLLLICAQFTVAYIALKDGGRIRDSRRLGRLVLAAVPVLVVAGTIAALANGTSGALGDRPAYWHAAWADYLAHPFLGSGAGSFAAAWLHYRTIPSSVVNAHSLYLETLAELGPLGLALLVAMLAVPLTAIPAAARRQPNAVAAACAYIVFLVHAGIDWDWQMPAVTIVALVAAAALLAAARAPARHEPSPSFKAVAPWAAATLALTAAAVSAIGGSSSFAAAASSADAGSWASAERLARTASRWEPWSAEPYLLLGEAQTAQRQPAKARASFTHALKLDPNNWRTWYELAQVTNGETRSTAIAAIIRLNPMAVQRLTPTR